MDDKISREKPEQDVARFNADAEEGLKGAPPEKTVVEIPESEYREYKVRLFAVAVTGVALGLAALVLSIVAFVL